MATVKELIALAKNEVGYREGKNNDNKYGKEYGMNNAAWCQILQWWLAKHVGLRDTVDFPHTASCPRALLWFKNKGRLYKDPQPGDWIFFRWTTNTTTEASHVGLVTKVEGGRVYTIEGNAGSASDRVIEKSYATRYGCIVGYGRLPLEGGKVEDETVVVSPRELRQGMTGNDVRLVQTHLYYNGYRATMYKPDGIFGPRTLTAVKKFQKAKDLTQDGIIGELTWKALLSK